MAMMTGKEYVESLRAMNLRVYMFGKRVENPVDDPILRPSVNSVRMTYDLAQGPNYKALMTATSHLTGETINRFTHIHQSTEDLVNKVKMQRLLGQVTAACFQRCVGMDAINAVYSTTYEIDQKYGTSYHENFRKFVAEAQTKDWTIDGAMTDPKGDRSLPPTSRRTRTCSSTWWSGVPTASWSGGQSPSDGHVQFPPGPGDAHPGHGAR